MYTVFDYDGFERKKYHHAAKGRCRRYLGFTWDYRQAK